MSVDNQAVSRSHDAGYLFYFLLLANLFQYMEAGAVPALLVTIADSFQMDAGQQGLLGGVVYLSLGVGGPCAGYLLKNFPHKLVVVGAVISNMLCTVFWAMTPVGHTYSTSLFILLRFLMGLCQCIICVYLPLWTNENAPKDKRTTWMSYLQASVPLGVMLGYIVASVFMNSAIASERISAEEVAVSSCAGIFCWRWPFLIEIFLLTPLYLGLYLVPEIDMDLTVRKRKRAEKNNINNAVVNNSTNNDIIVAVQDMVLSKDNSNINLEMTTLEPKSQEDDIEMLESNNNTKIILKTSSSNKTQPFFETPNKSNITSISKITHMMTFEGEKTKLLPMGTKSVDRNHTLKKQIGDLFAEDVSEKKRRMSLRRHSMNASLFDPLSIRDVIRRSHEDLSVLSFHDTPRDLATGGHMQPLESSSFKRHTTDTITDPLAHTNHIHSNYSSTGDFLTLLPEFSWEGVLPPSYSNSNRSSRGSYHSYRNSSMHFHRNGNNNNTSDKGYYFDSEEENDLDSDDAEAIPGILQRSQSAHVRSGDKHYHHKNHPHNNFHFSYDDSSLSYCKNNSTNHGSDVHPKDKDARKRHNNRHSVPARFKYNSVPLTEPDSATVQKVNQSTAVVSYESLRDVHRRQQAEGGGGGGINHISNNYYHNKRRTSSMGSTFSVPLYKEGEEDNDDEEFFLASNIKKGNTNNDANQLDEIEQAEKEGIDFSGKDLGETNLPATKTGKPRYHQIITENVDLSFTGGYASGSESESDEDWFSPVKLNKQHGKFFPNTQNNTAVPDGKTDESDPFFVQNRPNASDMEAHIIPLSGNNINTKSGNKRRRKAWYKALYKLMSIGIYRNILGAMTCLYFTVTGVQFWGTKYLTIALHAPLPVVNTLFVLCAATGPTLGVFFGGYLIDTCIGGYHGCKKRFQTLRVCALLGILGAGGALPITFVTKDNIYLVTCLLWCALFFGGATLPACSGILVSMVPREYRPLSSSVSMVVFNMCGYFASLIVSGYLMAWLEDHPYCFATLYMFFFGHPRVYDTVESFETAWECSAECAMTWGFRVILGWSFFSVCFIIGAYRDALRQYQRREEKKRVLQAAAVFAT